MSSKTAKIKLCWSCEGRVASDVENCPYCGVYLSPQPAQPGKGDPIVPPYTSEREKLPKDKKAPTPPYQPKEKETQGQPQQEDKKPSLKKLSMKEVLTPLLSLLSGAVFLLFGLILLLFSDQSGFFTLRWSSDFWPFYVILSVGLLFYGWRTLNQLPEE